MSNISQHLVVISIDALNSIDYDFIKTLPNFSSFITEGAIVKEVESNYPTVTYTCHTSIITGTFPNRHGIYSNEKINPQNPLNQEWFWYEKDIKVPTLFDYAKKEGLKTASVLWPVMAGAPIDYNCPEIWSVTGESIIKLFLKYASKKIFPSILKHSRKLKGKKQPYLDNFSENVAIDIIRKRKPNLLCLHLIGVDNTRHINGLHSNNAKEVLKIMDLRIGNIINATKQSGIYNNTTFILIGDHGTNNFDKKIEINSLFKKEGLLRVDKNNNITYWQAYASSCGGSVQIHLFNPLDKSIKNNTEDVLRKFLVMPNTCIKHFYTKNDVQRKYNLDGDFEYILEAKDGYVFRNSISDTIISSTNEIEGYYKADHGFEPSHKHMKTMLLAKGNSIKKNVVVNKGSLVDEAPTFAKILGIDMDKVDGKVINEILK